MRRQDGQIFPLMAALLLSVLALGFGLFQVARGAVLRSQAQTAADAAALAGARSAKQQLEAMMAGGGIADPSLIQDAPVRAAVADYAKRNGAVVVAYHRRDTDVKVRVLTSEQLGGDAKRVDAEDVRGAAKARARIEVSAGTGLGGGGGSGGGSGGAAGGGDRKVTQAEWDRFQKSQLDGDKPTCTDAGPGNDVIKLGRFLQSQGFDIGENAAFSGPGSAAAVGRSTTSQHYACGNAGALDINAGAGQSPAEMAALDPLIADLQRLGYATIWRAPGHYDHLHVDAGSASIGAGAGGGYGFGDQALDVRLIDWDAAYEDLDLLNDGTATATAGNPDPAVMRIMCSVLEDRNASARVRLATFETAIVESGVRNLTYGDRDSVGVFQQRAAGWGTFEQRTNVAYATSSFLAKAIALDRGGYGGTTGHLAQTVQVSAFPDRYDGVRGQAASLHNQYCGEPKISPND